MRAKREIDDIQIIEQWYQGNCNGLWEHRWGLSIQTCDNPGWLATFKDLPLKQEDVLELQNGFLAEYGAEIFVEGQGVRVFARTLRLCLIVAAKLIGTAKNE